MSSDEIAIVIFNGGTWLLSYFLKKLDMRIQPHIPFQQLRTNLLPLLGDCLIIKLQRSPRVDRLSQCVIKAENFSAAERKWSRIAYTFSITDTFFKAHEVVSSGLLLSHLN